VMNFDLSNHLFGPFAFSAIVLTCVCSSTTT